MDREPVQYWVLPILISGTGQAPPGVYGQAPTPGGRVLRDGTSQTWSIRDRTTLRRSSADDRFGPKTTFNRGRARR